MSAVSGKLISSAPAPPLFLYIENSKLRAASSTTLNCSHNDHTAQNLLMPEHREKGKASRVKFYAVAEHLPVCQST